MKLLALIIALSFVLPGATAIDIYHNITMGYDNGKISLLSVSLVPLSEYDTAYYRTINDYAAVFMHGNSASKIYYFDFNTKRYAITLKDDEVVNSYYIFPNKTIISAYFPYDKDATKIVVRGPKLEKLLTVELKKPEEAKPEVIPAKKPEEKPVAVYAIIAAAAVLALVLILLVLLRKKKE